MVELRQQHPEAADGSRGLEEQVRALGELERREAFDQGPRVRVIIQPLRHSDSLDTTRCQEPPPIVERNGRLDGHERPHVAAAVTSANLAARSDQDRPELSLIVEHIAHHVAIALLEHVQWQLDAREHHRGERKHGDFAAITGHEVRLGGCW